jgi:membrane protein insertase Oxa1/YidC/SpoIIIJ
MLIWWGEGIPVISNPADLGSFLYLGPFFNLLPVLAVALMLVQQKYMTPPSTGDDPQVEFQKKMMKYMMIFFGLLFYRVASGLCIYFIASSMWGLAERKLLPKKKAAEATAEAAPVVGSRSGKKPERPRKPAANPESTLGRLREWWTEVLKQAEKK